MNSDEEFSTSQITGKISQNVSIINQLMHYVIKISTNTFLFIHDLVFPWVDLSSFASIKPKRSFSLRFQFTIVNTIRKKEFGNQNIWMNGTNIPWMLDGWCWREACKRKKFINISSNMIEKG